MIQGAEGCRDRRMIIFKARESGVLYPYQIIAELEAEYEPGLNDAAQVRLRVDDLCLVFNRGHPHAQTHFDAVRINPEVWTAHDLCSWALRVCGVDATSANADVLWGLFDVHAPSVAEYKGLSRQQLLDHLSAWEGPHGAVDLAVTQLERARDRMFWA